MPPRTTGKGSQAIVDVYAEDEAIDAGKVDPKIKAEMEAILSRLTSDEPYNRGPRTITFGPGDEVTESYRAMPSYEDLADSYGDDDPSWAEGSPLAGDLNSDGVVDGWDTFLAGEPVGVATDPFVAEERSRNAKIAVESNTASGGSHQMLKNWLRTMLPKDSTIGFEDMIVPVGVGGEPDVKAALRINIFPYVKKDDYDHPYYDEAMLYQVREDNRAPRRPAIDLGGTSGVDFATRLMNSFLNR
tara:strand:+ start:10106 stop:10837 length:732 start_codon:yes stop_codon:yes gene_type:complete